MPDYKIMPDGEIRVLHPDLDRSWFGPHAFMVEIASPPAQRQRGLMG